MVSRLSLLQRKQLQWNREREELQKFGGYWGGVWTTDEKRYKPSVRRQFRSSIDLPVYREEEPQPKRRTPSLPPISNNYEGEEEEAREDTSGYASDSAGPEYNATEAWAKSPGWPLSHFPRRTPDSISSGSGREERAKWGDRGVGVGHLWEPSPTLPPPPLPRVQPATPLWIQRSEQEPAQVLVISHNEDAMSVTPTSSQGTARSCDTPLSSEGSQRSYIRGQNVPLDPSEMSERERKRQKALEHQNAIKKQLEEKERLRRQEQERQEKEERLAEERLRKQQELERQRLEEERRREKEKQEKDERIAQAMKEALEVAEKAAREEKARARRKHLRPPTPPTSPVKESKPQLESYIVQEDGRLQEQIQTRERKTETPRSVADQQEARRHSTPAQESRQEASPRVPPLGASPRTLAQEGSPRRDPSPRRQKERSPKREQSPREELKVSALPVPKIVKEGGTSPPRRPASEDREDRRSLAEEVELSVRLEQLEIEAQNLMVIAEPGRVLTPSKYRLNRGVERSTQTENKSRTKSTKRYSRVEERPKWGVNRPTNQYIKASDRDPFRRSRGNLRNSNRDSSSRSPSPLEDSKNSYRSTGKSSTYSLPGAGKIGRVSRGVCTPRVMQVVPNGGIIRKSSAGRRIISIKGSIGLNGSRRLNRPQQTNVLPKKLEVSEFLTVNQVLTQLMDLKQGLQMKQEEWEITRSPTPFSEFSYQ